MRRTAKTGRRDVFGELGRRLREVARDEQINFASGMHKFKVTSTRPLTLDQIGGDLVLVDGDPDVSFGKSFRAQTVTTGDTVVVLHTHDQEFHVFDVIQ